MTDPNQTTQTADRTGDESPTGALSRRSVLQSSVVLGTTLALGSGTALAQNSGNGDVTGDDLEWAEVGVNPDKPTAIDFDSEGRLWVANQGGQIQVADPETGESATALTLSVYDDHEHGAVGLTVDPAFEETNWIYLFYSPPESELDPSFDGGTYNLVSRFEVDEDRIDPNSEEEIIRIEGQREQPFHIGGGLDFGPDGALYISLGDNTHALQNHVSYFPHPDDEANTGDSRGTAQDTSDLRGSILRIVPEDDGSYSIPDGNLFPEDEYAAEIENGTVRPEIYAMGLRNSFQIHVDEETGWVFGAGQSTQASEWDADYGPPGLGPIFRFREPGNLGWPLFRGAHPYRHPEAAELVPEYEYLAGELYDTDGPINASPRNDGRREVPPIDEDATLAYAPAQGTEEQYLAGPSSGPWDVPDELPYPELADYSPIAGTVIRVDDTTVGGLPEEYDGAFVFGQWNTGDLHLMTFDENGDMRELVPFLTGLPNESFTDAAVGPDGRLYLVDWGEASFDPDDPTIYRISPDAEPEIDTVFELEGEIAGWTGVSPSEIAGEENPTLELEPGTAYRVEWTNADGIPHNFAIRNADEEVLLATELIDGEGETQTVEFTATAEMDHYLCEPHPTSMRGGIDEPEDDDPERNDNLGDPREHVTVGMTGGNTFDPRIAHVEPGGTVTWEFQGGQPHNTVAYHPDTHGDQQRIPDAAEPWESDTLSTEGETFSRTFEEPGVYDYVCAPHESAGMAGTVVVGWPDPDEEPGLEPVSDSVLGGAQYVLEEDNEDVREVLEDDSFVVNGYEPQDTTGDGLYNDFDGDGQTTHDDVGAFFESIDSDGVQENPDAFDFDDDGSLGFGDVVELLRDV